MSGDRFMLIMRCLHFNGNPLSGEPIPAERLFKIRPVIDYFNSKMIQIYYPDKNLSFDESMVLWRGRLVFRQYIKNKWHRYGVKLYLLTEPDGTILKFAVYTGTLDDHGGKGHAANIMLHLTEEKLDVGHSIYLDNYYNSYGLACKLLSRKTYCTGTLRVDRRENPVEVKKGEIKKRRNNCALFQWGDDSQMEKQ
ncbi:hypothetical protein NQ314_012174 [Rhamnusium bicolor]|uniref:PiggyBac transposable element-derived protein domain-containing protein n=1 Tax=Rhamnusium bicolor TaxID=1586634 RepID=A0AAV8XE47_9CUCU|nr:hypothetical protein NQ314_012174 [Rhamnusium bicolor]